MSTTLIRMSSVSSSTGILILSSIAFMTPCTLLEFGDGDRIFVLQKFGLRPRIPPLQFGQHDIARNFDPFAVSARHSLQVVLHHALSPFTEVFSKRFFDALEQSFIADSAFGREWRDSQEHPEKHNALHALLQVGKRGNFFGDFHS